jgi:hypothetical protein
MGAWALQFAYIRGIAVPPALARVFSPERYYAWGQGGQLAGLGCGVLVFLLAFSRRAAPSIAAIVGGVLMVAYRPVLDAIARPEATPAAAIVVAGALAVGGFGVCAMEKWQGGKF